MARRRHTYAIRLAVDGGGQVKAELISVGQSGEQSLKRIESAGEPEPMRGVQFLSAWVTLWVSPWRLPQLLHAKQQIPIVELRA
jgi:hypothetical protein